MKGIIFSLIIFFTFLISYSGSLSEKEDYKKETQALTARISKDPENVALYYERGTMYDALDDFEAANNDFSKAVELFFLKPTKKFIEAATKSCYYLADDHFFCNSKRESAMLFVEKGLSISPADKNLQIVDAAIIGAYPERKKEAGIKFDFLIKKYPEDEKLLFHYAKFIERDDAEKAAKLYEKLININPSNSDALFELGSYHTNKANKDYKSHGDPGAILDNTVKGVKLFEKVHQLNPDDEEIIEILIQYYGYLDRKADIEKMKNKLAVLAK